MTLEERIKDIEGSLAEIREMDPNYRPPVDTIVREETHLRDLRDLRMATARIAELEARLDEAEIKINTRDAVIEELNGRLALVEPLVEEACRFVDEYEDCWSSDALDTVTLMLRFQVRRVREAREKEVTP